MQGTYLLHFDRPYVHARHYVGWSPDIEPRVRAHQHGRGARLTQVVRHAGIHMVLVRVWDGDRQLERKLKHRKSSPRLCPICVGLPVQMPLLDPMPAYVPDVVPDEPEGTGHTFRSPPPGPTFFDYAAERDDRIEARADEAFWRSGDW